MVFDGKYFNWNQKRIKGITDFYGKKFFVSKTLLDLGCGYGDIGGSFYRLGADVTLLDARQEHLKIASKRYPGIKITRADLDKEFPFQNKKFDIVLDLGLLCHLADYESHIKSVCDIADILVLETAVCNYDDPYKSLNINENKSSYDLSVNGVCSVPTQTAIERVLTDCGMDFIRQDSSEFNSGSYKYDWNVTNTSEYDSSKRRIWFCKKNPSKIKTNNLLSKPIINSRSSAIKSSLNNAKLLLSSFSNDTSDKDQCVEHKTETGNLHQDTNIEYISNNSATQELPTNNQKENSTNITNVFNEKKDISIIIPAFQASAFLQECIDSIIVQTKHIKYEIIIGLDFCQDTLKWVINNKDNYNNIKFFWFKENVGPYIIKNTLVDFANSENILFFDADDVMAPTMINDFMIAIKSSSIVKFKYCDFKDSVGINKPLPNTWYGEGIFGIKKSLFNKLNGFEGWRCAADTEFHLRAHNSKIITKNVPNISFYRRLHSNNLTVNPKTKYGSSVRQGYIKIINDKTRTKKWILNKKFTANTEMLNSNDFNVKEYHNFMTNIFNNKYYACKKVIVFTDRNNEIFTSISNLGGEINILYTNNYPPSLQRDTKYISVSYDSFIKQPIKYDIGIIDYKFDDEKLCAKSILDIYKKSIDLIIYDDFIIENILSKNKIPFVKLYDEDDKYIYFCSKRPHIFKQINKKFIAQTNVEPNKSLIKAARPNMLIKEKETNNNLNLEFSHKIHHIVPWSTEKNIGKAYNEFMSLLQDEDWACFLDGDAVHTTTYFGKYIEQIVLNNPDYGLFTCYTNRIGCSYQMPGNYWNNDSQAYHRNIGEKLWKQHGTNVLDITNKSPLSGVLILINKSKWNEVGGFKEEKMLSVDNDIHLRFKNAEFKVGLMQGIYVQHWYRNGKQKEKSHLL